MARSTCDHEGCTSPALPAARVQAQVGNSAVLGMCAVHTMASAVRMAAQSLPQSAWETSHWARVEPYREWLQRVLETGTITYRGLTLRDVGRKTLAEVTGIHDVTISKVVNGHTSWARPQLHRALTPYMALTSTDPDWSVREGQLVHMWPELQYVPPLTAVVDKYRRVWQLRAGEWSPAHPPGETSRYLEGDGYQFRLPVRVIYLPPVLQDDTTA